MSHEDLTVLWDKVAISIDINTVVAEIQLRRSNWRAIIDKSAKCAAIITCNSKGKTKSNTFQ